MLGFRTRDGGRIIVHRIVPQCSSVETVVCIEYVSVLKRFVKGSPAHLRPPPPIRFADISGKVGFFIIFSLCTQIDSICSKTRDFYKVFLQITLSGGRELNDYTERKKTPFSIYFSGQGLTLTAEAVSGGWRGPSCHPLSVSGGGGATL